MLFGIGVLLGLSAGSLTYHVSDVAAQKSHRLQKRDWMLECDNTPVPVLQRQFASLNALCKGYPHGFGLICDDDGRPRGRNPQTDIAREYMNDLAHVCLNHCRCSNHAPDVPTNEEAAAAQFAECSMSNDTAPGEYAYGGQHGNVNPYDEPSASVSVTCARGADSAFVDDYNCNEYWYGKPKNADCVQAMTQLPDHGASAKLREFLPNGQTPLNHRANAGPIRTPILSTFGSCSVAILLPEEPGTNNPASILVDTLELNSVADGLRQHCVQVNGMGGKYRQKFATQNWASLPDIFLYAPRSKLQDTLDIKHHCLADDPGKCKSLPKPIPRTKGGAYGAWTSKGPIGQQFWRKVKSSKDSNRRKCGGSCLNPTDCDVNSDCLCASTKGMLVASSTWGQHACTYVAGAAAAIAAAAVKQPVCRGRCLLSNTEVFANTTQTNLSFDSINNPANAPSPPPPSTTVVLGNTSTPLYPDNTPILGSYPSDTSSSDTTPSDTTPSDTTPSDTAPSNTDTYDADADESDGILTNTTTPDPSINGVPTVANSNSSFNNTPPAPPLPAYAIFNDTSPNPSDMDPLTCPCNCTYVSAACCLSDSGIVYEPASMQIPIAPIPADEPICCDVRSGMYLWRSSGECEGAVVNGTEKGFVELGDQYWNGTFDERVGFPDDGVEEDNT